MRARDRPVRLIELYHRSSNARTNTWEFDPARGHSQGGALDVLIDGPSGPLHLTIPVCSPDHYVACAHVAGAHDHRCFCGYPIAPSLRGWVVASARFHALLARTAIVLLGAPPEIDAELREMFVATVVK